MDQITDGVWPTMVTPFTEDGHIDYDVLEKLVNWYLDQGVDGLFAVCQSSEMFLLSLKERVELAHFVRNAARGRANVIASGHISESLQEQMEEIAAISETGINAFVIVSNRLAKQGEPDDVWMKNAETILRQFPDVRFGIYECPFPYKRLMSPELLRWCANTGRFMFLKDTSCDLMDIEAKLAAVKGSNLKIFNANSATMLGSLRLGVAGFSGVMANFHPDLYVWLVRHWRDEPEKAELLQAFLSTAALIERQLYPMNAKYSLKLSGLPIHLISRSKGLNSFTSTFRLEVEQLKHLEDAVRTQILT